MSIRSIVPLLCALLVGAALLGSGSQAFAQRSAGDRANINPTFLIDMPVAGILPTTSGAIDTWLYPDGGVLVAATYGLLTNLNLGLSYGATKVIGSGNLTWNPLPGISIRYRLLEENTSYPAVVVGLDTQGKDGWLKDWKQYAVKSPGVFVTIGKNYRLLGSISFHGGINYTLERRDDDMEPNLFLGFEKSVGPLVSFLTEYNAAFDNDRDQKGFWNGSLNIGARISTNIGFNADFFFKNLLTSDFHTSKVVRGVRIQYVRYL